MRQLQKNDFVRMHLPHELWEAKLKKVPESIRHPISNYCFNAPKLLREGLGFTLMGSAGVGKTGAAAVLAKAVKAHSPTVFFVSISELREFLKERANFETDTSIYARCREVDFLVLDAVDKDFADDKFVGPQYLAKLVETRAAWRRATVITTRLTSDELERHHPDIVTALTDRNAFLSVLGPNLREARRAEIAAKLEAAAEVSFSFEGERSDEEGGAAPESKLELPGPRGRRAGEVVFPTFKTKNED